MIRDNHSDDEPEEEPEEEEVTFLALESEEEIEIVIAEEGTQVFIANPEGQLVAKENEANPDSGVTHVLELRTKLKFIGNQIELRNPEMLPQLISDVTDQEAKFEESKFVFCLHVGTSANEDI